MLCTSSRILQISEMLFIVLAFGTEFSSKIGVLSPLTYYFKLKFVAPSTKSIGNMDLGNVIKKIEMD